MIGALITILIYIIVLGVLWYAIDYAVTNLPVHPPADRFIRIAVVAIFCIIIALLLLSFVGVGGVNLPRLTL